MAIDKARVRQRLQAGEFKPLFIEELGWDRDAFAKTLTVDKEPFAVTALAQKRGVKALLCTGDTLPDYATRRKLQKQVEQFAPEHLVIFADAATQVWHWTDRTPGRPVRPREIHFHPGTQSGDALLRKLDTIRFTIDEEEAIDLYAVIERLKDSVPRDTVTKKFYKEFAKLKDAFAAFIKGIREKADHDWYTSLMLNRLMFVYFIQKKGFLDNDPDYLENRFKTVTAAKGKGKFHSFYRVFLLKLFHDGFAAKRSGKLEGELRKLLGDVPYLNGGLFDPHHLETDAVTIEDAAFEEVLTFFGKWEWTLDNRPLKDDRQINPDVLGYIFEKFINQKQMGAYYTKEDITDYIGKNTIIPRLFDMARIECEIAFAPGSVLWRLLQNDPDRYIYAAVRKGADQPLPANIEKGIADVSARGGWNKPAEAKYALPTETWREHVARRTRCHEVQAKLKAGEVHAINDLITLNLDIRQFASDCLAACEGPETVRAFYKAIESISVLDPTCGSGAFLFAALNILEPLYEACLDRMAAFVADADALGKPKTHLQYFRATLDDVAKHTNREYFIFKSIIVRNLYGVDIMPEAVEICKLRLFLKLVSQVDAVEHLEPLPDIDFNIRAGNTLVGFATRDDVKKAFSSDRKKVTGSIFGETEYEPVEKAANILDNKFKSFRTIQLQSDPLEMDCTKSELQSELDDLRLKLDRTLAGLYGIDPDKPKAFEAWQKSHQPFHWFAEFHGIMAKGGFDAVIGNPPYVVVTPEKVPYQLEKMQYETLATKNLYSIVFERSIQIATPKAPVGLIVQLTIMSAGKMKSIQNILMKRGRLYVLPFPRRPESIFDGVEMPVAILIAAASSLPHANEFVSAQVGRFYSDERPTAIETTVLARHANRKDSCRIAKLSNVVECEILDKFDKCRFTIDSKTVDKSKHIVYYQEACRYWLKALVGVPYFSRNKQVEAPHHGRFLNADTVEDAGAIACFLNSSLFYWYYSVFSDCEHVNDDLVRTFPLPSGSASAVSEFWKPLSHSLKENAVRKTICTSQGHTIIYDEYSISKSKPIIDRIDAVLAEHYGFTAEELDFIINYDIKYRMGGDAAGDGE